MEEIIMLHAAFRAFVRRTSAKESINFNRLFKHLHNLYQQDQRYSGADFSALIDQTQSEVTINHEKLLAYYLYYQDQQRSEQIEKWLTNTQVLLAHYNLTAIVDRYC